MNFQVSKYRKVQKARIGRQNVDFKNLNSLYGTYALCVNVPARISFSRLDSVRKTIKKIVKKNGQIWQRVFATVPVTAKPAEVRMGKGKGNFVHNVALLKAGCVLFELGGSGLSEKVARRALFQASIKLGVPTAVFTYFT